MLNKLLAIMILPVLIMAGQQSPPSQGTTTFSVAVNLVKVPITVFDQYGNSVPDLNPRDLRLYEDGHEQAIRSIGLDRNPVSVVLLLDASATVQKELKLEKEAAESFVDALTREDRVSVITFGDQVKLTQDWTSDMRLARKAIQRFKPELRTALYDAMYAAAREQLAGIEGRKAIILITDCLNNQSSLGFEDAALSVVQSQATLYVVSKTALVKQAAKNERRVVMLSDIYKRMFGDDNYIEKFFEKREEEMVDLADKTGGRCYFPSDYREIKGVYGDVARELKNQIYLTYVSNRPLAANSYHRIALEYLKPSNKLIFRKGYFFEPRPVIRRPVLKSNFP
jgi:Ca-activated chloride channel homolog